MAQAQDLSTGQAGVNLSVNIDTNYKNPETGTYSYPLPTPVQFAAGTAGFRRCRCTAQAAGMCTGMNIGATISSTSPDFALNFS